MELIDQGELIPLFVVANERVPELPEVPTFAELVDDPTAIEVAEVMSDIREVDRTFATGPGVPKEYVEVLRDAFMQALEDPGLLEEAAQIGRPIQPLRGDGLEEVMGRLQAKFDTVMALLEEGHNKLENQ